MYVDICNIFRELSTHFLIFPPKQTKIPTPYLRKSLILYHILTLLVVSTLYVGQFKSSVFSEKWEALYSKLKSFI